MEDFSIEASKTTDDIIVVEAKQFRQHVASHLQQLALFSIPRGINDDASDGCSSAAARQTVSSHSRLGRKTSADIKDVEWDDPNPPLQQAIAKGDLFEMMRLLDENVDPNTVGDTWGTAIDAAFSAPWDEDKREFAIKTLRKKGGFRAKELLEKMTVSAEINVAEDQARKTINPPNELDPNDRNKATTQKPEAHRTSSKPAGLQPGLQDQWQIDMDIPQLQHALASFGHNYDTLNIVHSKILVFLAWYDLCS